MSISDPLEFAEWLVSLRENAGGFTLLVILTEIRERRITPLCSTYFNVAGDDVNWDDLAVMFAGSGQRWDGAAFFPASAPGGGPIDNPTARLRLLELEARITQDQTALDEGFFCDTLGRRIAIQAIEGV